MKKLSSAMQSLLALSSTVSSITKRADRTLSIHGLSFTEFTVLHNLFNAPQQMMSRIALAEASDLTASGITRLLNPMEKIHLVEKEKNSRDARVSLVKLTDTGKEIYQDSLISCDTCAESLVKNLSAAQQDKLLELLEKLQ